MSNVPYLIIGATGARFARELVQRLFCPALCRACPHCTKLAHGTHPDLIWVSKSGKRISIDQVRELQQKALYPPVEAPQKIYVIESVEDLSLEAANSLLKILEEPPSYLLFILIAQSTTILPTILSRCRIIKLPPPPRAQIEQILRERGLSDSEIEILLGLTRGLMPDEPLIEAVRQFAPQRQKLQEQLVKLPDPQLWDFLSETNPFVRREAIQELLRRLGSYPSHSVLDLAALLSKCDREVIESFIQQALLDLHLRQPMAGEDVRSRRSLVDDLQTALWKLQRNANVQLLLEALLFKLRAAQAPA
jgi:DNA polymerase-3 subunit delta'